jgi:hypothetical protein
VASNNYRTLFYVGFKERAEELRQDNDRGKVYHEVMSYPNILEAVAQLRLLAPESMKAINAIVLDSKIPLRGPDDPVPGERTSGELQSHDERFGYLVRKIKQIYRTRRMDVPPVIVWPMDYDEKIRTTDNNIRIADLTKGTTNNTTRNAEVIAEEVMSLRGMVR